MLGRERTAHVEAVLIADEQHGINPRETPRKEEGQCEQCEQRWHSHCATHARTCARETRKSSATACLRGRDWERVGDGTERALHSQGHSDFAHTRLRPRLCSLCMLSVTGLAQVSLRKKEVRGTSSEYSCRTLMRALRVSHESRDCRLTTRHPRPLARLARSGRFSAGRHAHGPPRPIQIHTARAPLGTESFMSCFFFREECMHPDLTFYSVQTLHAELQPRWRSQSAPHVQL